MSSAVHSQVLREAAAEELHRRARAELILRQNTKAFRKAMNHAIIERGIEDTPPFEAQRRVLDDSSRLITLCCSRRGGKSKILSRIIAKSLNHCRHGEWVVYGAKTLGIAKDIIWADLHAINERFCLGWKINDSDLSITTLRQGRFRLFGVDDKDSVGKVRGKKYRLVVCDEVSTYEHLLKELVEQAFDPGTKDLDGRIILAGTPGYVKAGYWYEASQGVVSGWSAHHWTIFDNPHIGNVEEKLRKTREMFGYDEDHPTYIAEYLGRWVDNSSLAVCDYLESRNGITELPRGYNLTWRHVIGIDFGSVDACSWTVIAVDPHSGDRYVVEDFAQSGLVGDEPVEITRELVERYDTTYVVCDPGGGGKFFFETFNAKWAQTMQCHIRPADKQDLLGSIRLLNAELRMARLKFLLPKTVKTTTDIKRLLWKDERRDKLIEGPTFPHDRFDSLRYAVNETIAWRAKQAPPEETAEEEAERKAREARLRREQQKAKASWFERRR